MELTGPEKLVTVGLFSGVVRLFAQTEISQRQAGQDTAQWQSSLAGYLLQISAAGQHPHLAGALADQPGRAATPPRTSPCSTGITRILTGLLRPPDSAAAAAGGRMARAATVMVVRRTGRAGVAYSGRTSPARDRRDGRPWVKRPQDGSAPAA